MSISPARSRCAWICACVFLLPAIAFAADAPAGVIGLLSDDKEEEAAELIGAFWKVLNSSEEMKPLPGHEMVRRLSKGYRESTSSGEIKKLSDLFQQGYLQSYSFEYRQARETLSWVLSELKHFPPIPERWDLFVRANIFLGIALSGDKRENEALQAFATVLRCRPDMELSRKEYSPKTIRLWEKAKKRLSALPRGKLAVDSDPEGADVFLDGARIGSTPYIGETFHGRYHLHVRHKLAGSASRWVEIGKPASRIHLFLAFEGAMSLGGPHPLVRLPEGESQLPVNWWPWLGDRLGVRYLVAVHRETTGRIGAVLVDLRQGRMVRRGGLEPGKGELSDLAGYIVSGRAGDNVQVADVMAQVEPPEAPLVPPLPVLYESRSWYRKWWTWSIASTAFLIGGVTSHLLYSHYDDHEAVTVDDEKYYKDLSDTCQGLAIAGYALAGAALVTGLILDVTFEAEEMYALPVVGADFAGVGFYCRF